MANIRGEHVDRDVLHIRGMYPSVDRLLHSRLAIDLRGDVGTVGIGRCYPLAGTGKCSMARQSGPDRQGHDDSLEIRAHQQDQSARSGLQGLQSECLY